MSVVLFSGGIDSSVLLADLKSRGENPRALSVRYGQRHLFEIAKAQGFALQYDVLIYSVEVDLSQLAPCSLTGTGDLATRTLEELRKSTRVSPAYVPNRNAILIALAAAYALSIGDSDVFIGCTAEDAAGFPDCRKEFVDAIDRSTSLACGVRVYAPWVEWRKSAVIQHGDKIGVPFDRTYSCYAGKELHCGVCDACLVRRDAFAMAGVVDPTEYLR